MINCIPRSQRDKKFRLDNRAEFPFDVEWFVNVRVSPNKLIDDGGTVTESRDEIDNVIVGELCSKVTLAGMGQ